MQTNRLEAFSDGVFAILITIMVLQLEAPSDPSVASLLKLWPTLLTYALSFTQLAIYWVNHHELIRRAVRVDARVLWINNVLLFWLSLIPFATAYLDRTGAASHSIAVYAMIQIASSLAFYRIRVRVGAAALSSGAPSPFHRRSSRKRRIAVLSSVLSIPAAYLWRPLGIALLILPSLIFFIPNFEPDEHRTG